MSSVVILAKGSAVRLNSMVYLKLVLFWFRDGVYVVYIVWLHLMLYVIISVVVY